MREVLDDLQANWKMSGYPVVVIGTTSENARVPAGILGCFKQEINIEVGVVRLALARTEP